VPRAHVTVAAGTATSRATGLIRVIVFGAIVGQTALADAYDVANNAPNVVYELLLGGVLAATLVPLLSRHLDRGDDEATDAVVGTALVGILALTVLGVLLAPVVFSVFTLDPAAGVDAAALRRTGTDLTRVFMLQVAGYGVTALATALLNARRRFAAAAWAPVLTNTVTIAALLGLRADLGRRPALADAARGGDAFGWLALGSTLGVGAMALVVVVAAVRGGSRLPLPLPRLRHPAVRELLRASAWSVAYIATNQVTLVVVKNLAAPGSGGVDAYAKAFTIFQLPHGLAAVTIATTAAPELARLAARSDDAPHDPAARGEFVARFLRATRATAFLALPASLGLWALSRPIVAALLERGAFDAAATTATSRALTGLAVGLTGFSVYLLALRGFYSHGDTRTPFLVNAGQNALNVLLAVVLAGRYGVLGLGLAFSGSYLVAAAVALAILTRRHGTPPVGRVVAGLARMALAAGVMALTVRASREFVLGASDASGTVAVARVLVGVVVGVVAYAALTLALRVPEAHSIARGLLSPRAARGRRDG
jgi:putative peptidoglycan lipid II flippase